MIWLIALITAASFYSFMRGAMSLDWSGIKFWIAGFILLSLATGLMLGRYS